MENILDRWGLAPDLTPRTLDKRGWTGSLTGRIPFVPYPDYYLAISEVLDCGCGPDPRVRYTYQLFGINQGSLWGYHRDPRGHPEMPDHFHPSPTERVACTASLHMAEVLERAFATLASYHDVPRR